MRILIFCCDPQFINAIFEQVEGLGYETICAISSNRFINFTGNIRCLLYDEINSDATFKEITKFSPDYIFSVIFNEKIPDRIIKTARYHALNFHPALLPEIRTVSAWFWSVAIADKHSAISVHKLESSWDSGDIAYVHKVPIDEHVTQGLYYIKIQFEMPKVIAAIHKMILGQSFVFTPQEAGTYYSKPTLKDRYIDWSLSATHIEKQVRAGNPFNSTIATLSRGLRFEIHEVRLTEEAVEASPGTIIVLGNSLFVATCDRMLEVKVIGILGAGIFSAEAAIKFYGITSSERFESYEKILENVLRSV